MSKVKSFISILLTLAMLISSMGTVTFAAYNSGVGAYDIGDGAIISSTDLYNDGLVTNNSKNVQYDTGAKKKGNISFDAFSDNVYEKAMSKVFGEKYTYEGVIDYVGSGKDKNTLTLNINVSNEKNYYAYVCVGELNNVFMWVDNPTATIKAGTSGSKSPVASVAGGKNPNNENKETGVYIIDCGVLTTGKHTLTFDGAAGAWCSDICAVAVYPATAQDFEGPMEAYKDESLSYEERTADLISRMTLEEKVSQLGRSAPAIPSLGVSAYNYWQEAVHGVARNGKATSFPSSVSVANSWDPDVMRREADIISSEARAKNNQYNLNYWSPTINMQRDPRWGRNEESFSEDVYLTSVFGEAFVKGMQYGMEESGDYKKTIPTLKHFLANNIEGERQRGTSIMTEDELRNYYTAAFRNVTESSDPGSVMSSYNATTVTRNGVKIWDYIASPANRNTLTDLLRKNWGFKGFVVGDCGAVANLYSKGSFREGLYNSEKDGMFKDLENFSQVTQPATVALAIKAGNELDCGPVSQDNGKAAVEEGYMTEGEIDAALYRVFLERFKTGEFDNNDKVKAYRSQFKTADLEKDESVAVAEEAAEKGIVLLQNTKDSSGNTLLPLNKNNNLKIALIGEMAGQAYLGDYSGSPEKTVSPYEELQKVFGTENVDFLAHIEDGTVLFDEIESIILVKGSKEEAVDLTKATQVNGMSLSGGKLTNVKVKSSLVIPSIDFKDVTEIKVKSKLSEGSLGGSLRVGYGSNTLVTGIVDMAPNHGTDGVYTGTYSGADGGYNNTADMYIDIAAISDFNLEENKEKLDNADIILAYTGTISSSEKDLNGEMTDCKESNDRSTISLPPRDNHVSKICNYKDADGNYPYADKAVVIMQTVGQVDVDPFEEHCRAILWTCYNGQRQGEALVKILTGEVNPSGKLTTTWYNPEDLKEGKLQCGVSRVTEKKYGIQNEYYYDDQYRLAPENESDTYPGRTYMYYKGIPQYPFGFGLSYTEFEYSNIRADKSALAAGESFKISVDVENKGAVAGREVVQLYAKHNERGNGFDLPRQQLVGFGAVELQAGEKKTVEINVDTNLFSRYSEELVKNYIPTGNYTLWAGKNVTDNQNKISFSISGQQESKIKTIYAIPNGVTVKGAYDSTTNTTQAIITIATEMSAVMTDEKIIDLSNPEEATVVYSSSNDNIAKVDENGNVTAGTETGIAVITASVTVGTETESVTFPVVSKLQKAISAEKRQPYLDELDAAYNTYNESDYRDIFWKELVEIYNKAKTNINLAVDDTTLEPIVNKAKEDMSAVRRTIKAGESAYTITFNDGNYYWNATANIKYEGDQDNPLATAILAVFDKNGVMKKTITADCKASMDKDDSISVESLSEGDTVKCFVWDSLEKMTPLSKESKTVIQKPPMHMVYDLGDPIYNRFSLKNDEEAVEEINGVGGYGKLEVNASGKKLSYTHNGVTYTQNIGLRGTRGTDKKATLYFRPFDCYQKATVTVLFTSAAANRELEIVQDGKVLSHKGGEGDSRLLAVTAEITDLSKPVFIRAGGSDGQKVTAYTIIADYEGETDAQNIQQNADAINVKGTGKSEDDTIMTAWTNSSYLSVTSSGKITRTMNDEKTVFDYNAVNKTDVKFLKLDSWNDNTFAALIEDNKTKERKIILSTFGNLWYEPDYKFTEENSDLKKNVTVSVNDFIVFGDQIYAACDDGLIVVLTPCSKCYRLIKACDFDILSLNREENNINITGKALESKIIPITSLRQTNISLDEALDMHNKGAEFIDVRSQEEYEQNNYGDSINIPLYDIQKINEFSKDTVLIFYCSAGSRAAKAVEYAQKNGFLNIYNLGSISLLME